MIAYTDDLAIHGDPIGEATLYKQMTTALKKIETKSMQLGPKFSPGKCEALWYTLSRSLEKRSHHRQKTKLQETSRLHKTKI